MRRGLGRDEKSSQCEENHFIASFNANIRYTNISDQPEDDAPFSPHRSNFHLINFKGSNFTSFIFGLMLIINVVYEVERNFGEGKLNLPAESGPPGVPLSQMKLPAPVIIFLTFPISA